MPHGCVTVSVIQYRDFSHQTLCPGCQLQPDTHTATGIISSSPAPTAVRFAIDSIASPFVYKSHNHN